MTDNFLGADKSLGEPQVPGHRDASLPDTWEWLPAQDGGEDAVTQDWKLWDALCGAGHWHCVHVFHFLGAPIHQNELYQDVQHSGSILGSHGNCCLHTPTLL